MLRQVFAVSKNLVITCVCSGSRSGFIHHHDVRVAQHLVGSLAAHQQEVCGLKWSPDGKYLASGGNDNQLNIWQADPGTFSTSSTPVHTFSQHQAAVKVSIMVLFHFTFSSILPHAGYGAVSIDPLHFLAGCGKGQLNQVLSVFCISMFYCFVVY